MGRRNTLFIARQARVYKERCHGNQILAKIGKNLTEMAKTAVICDTSTHECRVWFWRTVSAISKFICDTPIHKG